jgi:hypothetical protein
MEEKKRMVYVTGMTESQMVEEMEAREETGKTDAGTSEKPLHCYFCKRQEGDKSVLVDVDKEVLHVPPITLKTYEIEMANGDTLCYWLCEECSLLLQDIAEKAAKTGKEQ